ncbi:alpha/beta fold hydrolase [Alteromonas confluentis]|uniref:Alpha/beta hydrolase n=1 Tax=Alteromonas confluentis TaxID=1656094 RepID=A0A1E7ZC11_9ALTE|nr:alpha/beta hydrolase [Alteromonas confluentis]OFC71047.1 alpha/beta hydrolase [Alteromonas confluentis]
MKETEFQLGDIKLSALDNQGAGTVVIGLHGFLDNAASLAPLAPYLQNSRFIALDLAGHGHSSHRPAGAHYHQADFLQDLYALITENAFSDVILLGHSLGGILATLYAAAFPDQIKAVISIDACGPLTKSADSSAEQLRESIQSRFKKRKNRLNIVDLEGAVKARCAVSDIDKDNARVILSRNLTQDASGHCFWSSDPKLRTKSTLRFTEEQAEALMRNVRCPVWFAAASNSFKKMPDVYSVRKDWFVSSQCEVFEGGHHIHMEKTDEVGRAIRQFVEQL